MFVALDKRNYLYTWNILTGKLIHKHRVEGIDLSGYEIYSYEDLDVTYRREWFQPKTLIREIKALEGYNDDKFFDEDLLR